MIQKTNTEILKEQRITTLSFSREGDYCAVGTKKDSLVRIFEVHGVNINGWVMVQTLKEHMQTVATIDWAMDDKLITASHDRSVVVWRKVAQAKWYKMLVNVYSTLSILIAKWAPSATKFAFGSSCCNLALGYYSRYAESWTVILKKDLFKSSILTLSFHTSSNVLAVGSTDCSLKVFTCNLAVSSAGYVDVNNNYSGPFAKIKSSFELLYNLENIGCWLNHVSFYEGGNTLLVLTHGGPIKIFAVAEGSVLNQVSYTRWKGLPFLNGFIDSRGCLIVGGFYRKVARFVRKDKYFNFEGFLTRNESSNKESIKKGIVGQATFGIERKDSFFGNMPSLADHMNTVLVTNLRQTIVSYDINGVIHFWY